GIPVNVTSAMLTPGDRTFATYCKPTAITDELLERVYTMSKGAKLVQMQEGFLPVYRKLHEEGTILIFDMGWDDELSFEKYGDYLRLADYYTPNTKEALKITGRDTPEEALRVLAEYFEHPLVKLDKDGCLILEDGRPRLLRNIPEFTCKDSTGAGDAFLAGLMYGLYHGYPFADCVRFGNITGGKSVTGVGCLTEYVQESELLALREKYKDL
ncbi:MAG: carbohydrate kinase family protein, partial [Butyricicoccus sp.]